LGFSEKCGIKCSMNTSDLDYVLPPERIAQHSVEPRDQSRLLVVRRGEHMRPPSDRHFFELPQLLQPGDLLVRNNTKVFPARLTGLVKARTVELFLLRPRGEHTWEALLRPGRSVEVGSTICVADGRENALFTVEEKTASGTVLLQSALTTTDTLALAQRVGAIPVPPYIHELPTHDAAYQTVYANHTGSVAAPTSGFHFTDRLIDELIAMGVRFADITLHVGLGTFQPIKSDRLEDHAMHAEWAELPQATVDAIANTKAQGGRVIAVGTTTTRTLEGIFAAHGQLVATAEDIPLFITPGFPFRVIDGLITNFHLPKTTLLSLVAAFLEPNRETPHQGLEQLHALYRHALDHEYRFASFGDAMLILS
jgi:S-adenosylmethionine:tRNA ribosyltransferase-isomerase